MAQFLFFRKANHLSPFNVESRGLSLDRRGGSDTTENDNKKILPRRNDTTGNWLAPCSLAKGSFRCLLSVSERANELFLAKKDILVMFNCINLNHLES